MKRLFLINILLVFISLFSFAQGWEEELKAVSNAELEMTSYDKDKDAEAVVLLDLGSSDFIRYEGGFMIYFDRIQRIKVLTEAGLEYAEFEVEFYQEGGIYETVKEIEGFTYNIENGVRSRTKLDVNTCFTEKINENWMLMKIPMPNVKVGSVIELKYRVKSQYIFNLRDWEFQRSIPTVYSKYKVQLVPFYEYTYILQGANKFDYQESYENTGLKEQYGNIYFQRMTHEYAMKDVPAFRGEEFITSRNDYIIKMDFQLSKVHQANGISTDIQTTWEDMIDEYLKSQGFGKYIKKSQKLYGKVLNENLLALLPDSSKLDFVVDVVKSNISWDGYYARQADVSPKKMLEKKTGDVAAINLFLTGLLREAGFEAIPVLISTRSHGRVSVRYPFVKFFNYVVVAVKVGDTYILTDATTPLTINHRIPPRCINNAGLMVKEGEVEWLPLTPKFTSNIKHNINIELDDDKIKSEVSIEYTEYDAYEIRLRYSQDSTKLEEDLDETYANSTLELKEMNNLRKSEYPFSYVYSVEASPERINGKIYVSPFLGEVLSENPLKQTVRTYDIDMTYPKWRSYHAEMLIPEGYTVEYFPLPTKISNDDFYLYYVIKSKDGKMHLDLEYAFWQSVYPGSTYSNLKYYYNEIVKKVTDKIVFVKSEG